MRSPFVNMIHVNPLKVQKQVQGGSIPPRGVKNVEALAWVFAWACVRVVAVCFLLQSSCGVSACVVVSFHIMVLIVVVWSGEG